MGWEAVAKQWTDHVRRSADVLFAWNVPTFCDLLPAPARLTVEVGCGEGRVPRELARLKS